MWRDLVHIAISRENLVYQNNWMNGFGELCWESWRSKYASQAVRNENNIKRETIIELLKFLSLRC